MRKSKMMGILAGAALVGLAGVTNAAMIGINIEGASATSGQVLDTANLGVTSTYQQTHWNNIVSSQQFGTGLKATYTAPDGDTAAGGSVAAGGSYLDSTGAAVTGLEVLWAGSASPNSWTNGTNTVAAPANSGPLTGTNADINNIYNGYLYSGFSTPTTNNQSVEIKNIPYSTYDIVVYGSNGTADVSTNNGVTGFDGTTGLPTGGTSISQGNFMMSNLSTWTPATSSVAGNYFVLSNLSGSDQTITASTTSGQFWINAVQITPVPEPTSLALLSLGGLALLRRRRRGDEATV